MFVIQNVKPRTILIVGGVSCIILILVGIAIFFLIKPSPTIKPSTTKPSSTIKPSPTGREEVYLYNMRDIMIEPGQFEEEKANIFPNNSNITLATIQQIKEALAMGLETCDSGIAMDMNTEIFAFVAPGEKSMNTNPACFTSQRVDVFQMSNIITSNIWVYGVKPPNGTVGVSRFSIEKWSLYDPLPIITQKPIPVGPKEVYIQALYEPIQIPPDKFQTIKRIYFPNNPNITLATVQQIELALNGGLKVCNTAMAFNDMGIEILLTACVGTKKITDASVGTVLSHIWVYGVKPPNGTVGISPFSLGKWSIYDT